MKEPIKSVLCECDAIRLECIGARMSHVLHYYHSKVLIEVRYPSGNVATVELTQGNAWQLKEWLKEVVPGADPSPDSIRRKIARLRERGK